MPSRLIQIVLALSLLLNTFVLVGFVYRSWIAPPYERPTAPPPGPPGSRPGALDVMAHDLNLDDGQRQALRGVFDQYSNSRRERLREIQKLREQIAAQYKQPATDMARGCPVLQSGGSSASECTRSWPNAWPRRLRRVSRAAARDQVPDVLRNRSIAMVAKVGRRVFVGGVAALSAGLWVPRPGRAASVMDFDEARHLLSRTSFGATPAEIRALGTGLCRRGQCLLANVRRGPSRRRPGSTRGQPSCAACNGGRGQQRPASTARSCRLPPGQEEGRELRNWWVEEIAPTSR
jgi:hypothetical protein